MGYFPLAMRVPGTTRRLASFAPGVTIGEMAVLAHASRFSRDAQGVAGAHLEAWRTEGAKTGQRALERLRAAGVPFEARIVGEGPLQPEFEKPAGRLGDGGGFALFESKVAEKAGSFIDIITQLLPILLPLILQCRMAASSGATVTARVS
mgnify:CR=1 FL=1